MENMKFSGWAQTFEGSVFSLHCTKPHFFFNQVAYICQHLKGKGRTKENLARGRRTHQPWCRKAKRNSESRRVWKPTCSWTSASRMGSSSTSGSSKSPPLKSALLAGDGSSTGTSGIFANLFSNTPWRQRMHSDEKKGRMEWNRRPRTTMC